LDQVESVVDDVAVFCHDDGDGLADIADAVVAMGRHSTGALTPTTRLLVRALISVPVRIAVTPGRAAALAVSIAAAVAWPWGERRMAACRVPGGVAVSPK
jgi:hypothetical protein